VEAVESLRKLARESRERMELALALSDTSVSDLVSDRANLGSRRRRVPGGHA
jgi:hypothetical protein